jgi:hypothetical protein
MICPKGEVGIEGKKLMLTILRLEAITVPFTVCGLSVAGCFISAPIAGTWESSTGFRRISMPSIHLHIHLQDGPAHGNSQVVHDLLR